MYSLARQVFWSLTVVLVAVSCGTRKDPAVQSKPPHPMAGGNSQRTGFTDRKGPLTEPAILWVARPGFSGGEFTTQPLVDEQDNIYANCGVSNGDNFISYTSDGKERWRFSRAAARSGLSAPALTEAGALVSGCRDSYVRSLDRRTGKLNWEVLLFGTTYGILSSPVADREGRIYVGGVHDGGFYKLEPASGTVVWSYLIPPDGRMSCSPALSPDEKTVYFGRGSRQAATADLYALNVSDGSLKWKLPFAGASFEWSSPTVGADGTIYIQDSRSGVLFALRDNGSSCNQEWQLDPDRPGDANRLPSVVGDTVYLGTTGPGPVLIAVGVDGKERWRQGFRGEGMMVSNPVVNEDAVYVTVNGDGGVYCLSRKDGSIIWRKQVAVEGGDFAEAVTLGNGGVLLVGVNGTSGHPGEAVLVALKAGSGEG